MKNAIVVRQTSGNSKAEVKQAAEVIIPDEAQVELVIGEQVSALADILSGKAAEDPTKKKCSRCLKLGRQPFHNLDQFSVLKNGKHHSQCKACRVEQSDEWCAIKYKEREEYHKNYRKTHKRKAIPKAIRNLMQAGAPAVDTRENLADAMFVTVTNRKLDK